MENDKVAAIEQVVNSAAVYDHFGYWPDFHDAEVPQVLFQSHITTGRYSITFTIESAEFTNELNLQGQYLAFRPCVIKLQFTGIKSLNFDGFYFQNVLSGLRVEMQGGLIKCSFFSVQGLDAVVVAEEAIVLSVETKS